MAFVADRKRLYMILNIQEIIKVEVVTVLSEEVLLKTKEVSLQEEEIIK